MRRIIVAALALISTVSLAETATLNLSVSGTILPRPQFQNASAEITSLAFAFSGVDGAGSFDSDTKQVALVNALSYPATVTVTAPSSCTVGTTAISNPSVFIGGSSAGASYSFSDNSLANMFLRIAPANGTSGSVSCSNNGSLVYTY